MECKLNCYGDSSIPVPLPGGDGNGVKADSQEVCRDYCMATDGCEAIVYGQGMCYGKKDVRTSKCQTGGGGFVTEMVNVMPYGTCTLMGDPHVLTFDNPNGVVGDIAQLDAGDYWLVKSASLLIQGRFGFSSRFPADASTTGIAISGGLIQNRKLVVEYVGPAKGYTGFKAFWDGSEILASGLPAAWGSPDGLLKASLANMDPTEFNQQARHTIGGTEGDLPSFLFEIVPNIRVYLLLGEETMNAVITVRRPDGSVDGYCGTFDCDPTDDTLEQLTARGLAAPIEVGSLFAGAPAAPDSQAHPQGTGGLRAIGDCAEGLLKRGEEACKSAGAAAKAACIFDFCASKGDAHAALEDVVATAVTEDAVMRHFELFGLKLPPLLGASIPAQLQWGLAAGLFALLVGSTSLGRSSRRCASRGGQSALLRIAADEEEAEEREDEEALLPPAAEYDPIGR